MPAFSGVALNRRRVLCQESAVLQPGRWGGESSEEEVRKVSYKYKHFAAPGEHHLFILFFPFAPLESTVH